MQAKEFTNDLINEDSPYLRQHAHNPVKWMAWGDKAFKMAQRENKLIFLSIGYSTCHWCHVMEKETFENEALAKILNNSYISIKVDREERPDIDKYYQDIFYFLNRRAGGWPLSIVMTPNRDVIFAATYLPPESRNGMSGFGDIMYFIAKKFKTNPKEIYKSAESIKNAIVNMNNIKEKKGDIGLEILEIFVKNIQKNYDYDFKGIGKSPKFPHATAFDTLLDIYAATKNIDALHMVEDALTAMANGGINDQIEGGFYRYSVDEAWMIPHFEKMLYTNAELIALYSRLYKIKKSLHVRDIVETTVNAMDERFLESGLYKSASDADSEGEEGKYFVFGYEDAVKALKNSGFDKINIEAIMTYFNISKNGNFENGMSNPYIDGEREVPENLEKAKSVLKNLRSRVSYPFIDNKILTSWNSLMATALFKAGYSIDEKYSEKAKNLVDNILANLMKDGILYHQLVFKSSLKVKGLLEDYSFLIDALILAYDYSSDKKYLDIADKLKEEAIEKFYTDNSWYLSESDFKSKASLEDASYKSAMAKMIENIFVLSLLNQNEKDYEIAYEMFENIANKIKMYPAAYPEALKIVIMIKKGVILLKAPRQDIKQICILQKKMFYPFIYKATGKENIFQACSFKSCFAYQKNISELEKKIISYLK